MSNELGKGTDHIPGKPEWEVVPCPVDGLEISVSRGPDGNLVLYWDTDLQHSVTDDITDQSFHQLQKNMPRKGANRRIGDITTLFGVILGGSVAETLTGATPVTFIGAAALAGYFLGRHSRNKAAAIPRHSRYLDHESSADQQALPAPNDLSLKPGYYINLASKYFEGQTIGIWSINDYVGVDNFCTEKDKFFKYFFAAAYELPDGTFNARRTGILNADQQAQLDQTSKEIDDYERDLEQIDDGWFIGDIRKKYDMTESTYENLREFISKKLSEANSKLWKDELTMPNDNGLELDYNPATLIEALCASLPPEQEQKFLRAIFDTVQRIQIKIREYKKAKRSVDYQNDVSSEKLNLAESEARQLEKNLANNITMDILNIFACYMYLRLEFVLLSIGAEIERQKKLLVHVGNASQDLNEELAEQNGTTSSEKRIDPSSENISLALIELAELETELVGLASESYVTKKKEAALSEKLKRISLLIEPYDN